MAFEDEARIIGADFSYLFRGNLRENAQNIQEWFGVSVPYSSYDNLWSSLISKVGVVNAARRIVEEYMKTLSPEAERVLRRSAREKVSEQEAMAFDLWDIVIDSETGKADDLGLFVLKYGKSLSEERGRLSAVTIYQISASLHSLLQARNSDDVVFNDGSAEQHGDRAILGHLKHLERLLIESNLSPLESERLRGLIQNFGNKYYGHTKKAIEYEDYGNLIRVIEKIEAVVCQEIVNRDFTELTPRSGILDYQKTPSDVLDGLLGDVAYSIPEVVRHDLEEAIRCLRFGAPTASVMVGLRAVEGWLRELYYVLAGKNTSKGWKVLLDEIQNLLNQKGVPIETIAGFLNYVRDVRNTADHPDKNFTQIESEQTFITGVTAIREIHRIRQLHLP